MHRTPRALLFSLALGLVPAIAAAAEDDLEFDDDFFDEVKQDKRDKTSRDDPDLTDDEPDGADPDEDPEWDAPLEPDIIDDPPGDFGGELGEDPPADARRAAAAPVGGLNDFDEDPPDDLGRPAPRKPEAAKPAPRAAPPAGPARLTLKTAGKEPLSGAYGLSVVALDVDAVVVEIPVLVAASGAGYAGGEFMVVAEFLLGGKKVGESRHLVSADTIADLGPTVLWVKQHVPVSDPSGRIEVKVSRVDAEDPPSALFTQRVDYKL